MEKKSSYNSCPGCVHTEALAVISCGVDDNVGGVKICPSAGPNQSLGCYRSEKCVCWNGGDQASGYHEEKVKKRLRRCCFCLSCSGVRCRSFSMLVTIQGCGLCNSGK